MPWCRGHRHVTIVLPCFDTTPTFYTRWLRLARYAALPPIVIDITERVGRCRPGRGRLITPAPLRRVSARAREGTVRTRYRYDFHFTIYAGFFLPVSC